MHVLSAIHAGGREYSRTAAIVRGRQVFTKMARQVLIKVRWTTGNARGWVMMAMDG